MIVALLFELLRSTEAHARNATKRLEAFLDHVSHELRNSLGALGTAEVLAQSGGSRKAALALQGQARHIMRMVGDLSDLSRLERGGLTPAQAAGPNRLDSGRGGRDGGAGVCPPPAERGSPKGSFRLHTRETVWDRAS